MLLSSIPYKLSECVTRFCNANKLIFIAKGITVSHVPLNSNSDIQSNRVLNVETSLGLGLIVSNSIIRNRNKVGSRM